MMPDSIGPEEVALSAPKQLDVDFKIVAEMKKVSEKGDTSNRHDEIDIHDCIR